MHRGRTGRDPETVPTVPEDALMTAEDGRTAFDLVAAALRKLRGYWIVTTFALGAFLWVWDTWQAHAPLPDALRAQETRLDRLERRMAEEGATGAPAARAVAVPPWGPWLLLALDRACPGGRAGAAPGPRRQRP